MKAGGMRVVSTFFRQSWNIRSLTKNRVRSYVHDDRTRKRYPFLAKAILQTPPHVVAKSVVDQTTQADYTKNIYERLDMEPPSMMLSEYPDESSYVKTLKSLVVEEARCTVATELSRMFPTDKGNDSKRKQGKPVRVRIESFSEANHFLEMWTHIPLSNIDRDKLRAGSVIVMCKRGVKVCLENMVLGMIQFGSPRTRSFPSDLFPSDTSDAQKQRKEKAKGDRLTCFVFQDWSFESSEDYEIQYIASILNFQRQFIACSANAEPSMFGKKLFLGPKSNTHVDEDGNHDDRVNEGASWRTNTDDRVGETFETSSEQEAHKQSKTVDSKSLISVPALNESQELAAESFLLSREGEISIVQGPPGTGKTTMTVAIICRYILESRGLSNTRKLLVCGPTNRSVVVLARKVLKCIAKDASVNAVVIGDQSELLSDNNALEPLLVNRYLESVKRRFKALRKRHTSQKKKKNKEKTVELFKKGCERLLSQMRSEMPSISLWDIEMALDVCESSLAAYFSAPTEDRLKDAEKSFDKIFDSIRKLDEQAVILSRLNSAHVIFCTLSTAGCMPMRRMDSVTDLIVDEATVATEPELLIPLCAKPKRLLLVGDPQQLPPTIISSTAEKLGLRRSLQERFMFKNDFDFTLLEEQYRMHPEISKWPAKEFYDCKLRDSDHVSREDYSSSVKAFSGNPYTWVQVNGFEAKDQKGSTYNEMEARQIASILQDLKKKHGKVRGLFEPDRVRVLTFYQAQVEYISFLLKKEELGDVTVSTVDASQGSEADIVILSFTRGASGHIGFLKDHRRLNVALTRAKHQLICVGNLDALANLPEKGGNFVVIDMAKDALLRVDPISAPST